MSEKILNGVQKASNRALNIGKNTHVPMEGCISGVRPSAVTRCALPLMELTLDMVTCTPVYALDKHKFKYRSCT